MTQHISAMQVSVVGAMTGTLVGFARTGAPLVDIPSDPPQTGVAARSCVPLSESHVGRQVVVVPDADNPDSPIVLGLIRPLDDQGSVEIVAAQDHVSLQANESITLTCGDASIKLNRNGTVVIRGKHVISHAAGVNRVRGGSVELN